MGKCVVLMAAMHVKTRGIGYQEDLPWSIPEDWEYFERITTKPYGTSAMTTKMEPDTWHNVIITGRKTWDAKQMNKQPLPNRFNIVLSRNPIYRKAVESFSNAAFATSLEEALMQADNLPGRTFILGGSEVYAAALKRPECTHVLLTHVYCDDIVCDTFMPPIDMSLFQLASHEELEAFVEESVPRGIREHGNTKYEFLLYKRTGNLPHNN
ncbi:dihydrofolate reductase [Apophysomyces ossiformis]|uniref:Dihydrofolate reductase n=1 Tax=Apophysomyces ossiformis TaxID=679940 RepID=A0A8H7ETB6_9FUNG|nr:dihydrofolate reductase [Apophysomyces ossiformis]